MRAGEGLDPLAKPHKRHPNDHRPVKPFESVIRGAADIDDELDRRDQEKKRGHLSSIAEGGHAPDRQVERMKVGLAEKERKSHGAEKEWPKESVKKDNKNDEEKKNKKKKENKYGDTLKNDEWSMAKANIPGRDKVSSNMESTFLC